MIISKECHMPISSGSLVTANKLKSKDNFHMAVILLLYILQNS